MSEIEKTKRRFWQFHLSTAVVLMVLSSVMLIPVVVLLKEAFDPRNIGPSDWLPPELCIAAVFVYLLVAISFLYGIGSLLEWLIRRREARKT